MSENKSTSPNDKSSDGSSWRWWSSMVPRRMVEDPLWVRSKEEPINGSSNNHSMTFDDPQELRSQQHPTVAPTTTLLLSRPSSSSSSSSQQPQLPVIVPEPQQQQPQRRRRLFSEGCLSERSAARDCIWKYDVRTCNTLTQFYKVCRDDLNEKRRLEPPEHRRPYFGRFRSVEEQPTSTTSSSAVPASLDPTEQDTKSS